MLELLAEGVESIRLACSWVLLAPAIGVTLFGRRRPALVVSAFFGVATTVAWLRFGGWWFAVPSGVLQVLLGLSIIGVSLLAWRADHPLTDAAAAVIAGVIAVWTWIPCVGPRFGDLLNGARSAPFDHIAGTAAYMAGLFVPFVLVVALGVAFPAVNRRLDDRRLAAVGLGVLLVFGVLLATTLFDDLSSELARRSTF